MWQARQLRPVSLVMAVALLVGCNSSPTASAPPQSNPGASSNTATNSAPAATPGGTSDATLPPVFGTVFDTPSNPSAITPTLDDAAAAEADIPVDGGTLTATAADGTKFVLAIPNDALAAPTHIRMVPVASIAGMPFGTDPHAVQLEPEGLQFLAIVTLTITPSTAIPADQQILFGWHGATDELSLALPAGKTADIAIALQHFSGAGVTSGPATGVVRAMPLIGSNAEARLTSAVAAELGRARQAALLGVGDPNPDYGAIYDFLGQFYEQVVKPRMAVAGRSCADGTFAIQSYLGYHRQAQLLGLPDDDMSDEPDLVKVVADVCVREEYQRCHDQHVIQNMIPTWLSWERTMQLLGAVDQATSDALEAYVKKCLVFDVRFESQATFSQGGTGWDTAVRADVEIRFRTDGLIFGGNQGNLDNFLFKFKAPGCTVTSKPGGGVFQAIDFKYVRATRSPTDYVGYVSDVSFSFNPGATSETAKIKCGSISAPVGSGFWSASWIDLHLGDGATRAFDNGLTAFAYTFTDWEIFGNAYYAKKEWIKSGNGVHEAGTLKLYHTPE